MRTELPIATGYYVSSSIPVAAQECTNWYVSVPETSAYTKAQLFQTPGLQLILNVGDEKKNRGAHVMAGVPYLVCGQRLYRLDRNVTVDGVESFNPVDIGEIEGADYVSMADNGDQLCIVVPDIKGYIYTRSTDTLQTITSAPYYDLGPSRQVVYAGSYFIHQSQRTLFNSAPNDGLSYDGLDFAEAESDPDDIVGIHVSRGQLFVGGSETTEIWQNVGALNFPFQPIQGSVLPVGVRARNSIVPFGNSFGFVGADIGGQPAIYQFSGNNFDRISTTAIEYLLLQYSQEQVESIVGFQYSQDGAVFAGWILPDTCLVYDAKASSLSQKPVWHERKSFINGQQTRWRVNSVVQAYNRLFAADFVSGRIGQLSSAVHTEYGEYIRRRVTAGPFNNSGGCTFWSSVQLIIDGGNDTVAGRGGAVDMSYSDDGGKTWGVESTREVGMIGEYKIQPTWNRLGMCRNARVYRFDFADNCKLVIIGLIGDFGGGR